MNQNSLLGSLQKVRIYANISKFQRFCNHPLKYVFAIFMSKILARFSSFGVEVKSKSFWGVSMSILLPSSVDIFLSGGKTHDSEIRLSQFLLLNINEKDVFYDIGAHIGYFSLLVSQISSKIKVFSIEASKKTFSLLEKNTKSSTNITVLNIALSEKIGQAIFYEFPPLYAEYNTMIKSQYDRQHWFLENTSAAYSIDTTTGDQLCKDYKCIPTYIKMDVEGAEFMVIKGLENTLRFNNLILIMEFARDPKINEGHVFADQFLKSLGYGAYRINDMGVLIPLEIPTEDYVKNLQIESDNVVYKKNEEKNLPNLVLHV